MTVLIDSNVIIVFLEDIQDVVIKIDNYIKNNIPFFVSSISIYEVYLGIVANLYLKQGRPSKVPELLSIYEKFLIKCQILNFDRMAAEKAAEFYAQAQGKGITIKEKDCLIASIAIVNGISEVFTFDNRDFSKISEITGLKYTE